jgi:hypothetical protein
LDVPVRRVPLLVGSSIHAVDLPDDAILLAAPPPLDPIADVPAAVADALRYPLSGPGLQKIARRGGRATLVVEHDAHPFPGAPLDPRQEALAAVSAELGRAGIPTERQTMLVAGGLERRAGRRELETLLRPAQARAFRGAVVVHDCEDEALAELGDHDGVPLRVNRALVETDLVVIVGAAETVLHGGPATLLRACGPEAPLAAAADSLLEPATAAGWRLAAALERAVSERVPLLGVSLVLDLPRPTGRWRGWPSDPATADDIVRSRLRRAHNAAPGALRERRLQHLARELRAAAAFAGRPSVAHAEALLRSLTVRAAGLAQPVDTLVVPAPWRSHHHPRAAADPIAATHVALGVALRLWREQPPLRDGGTIVLLHHFRLAYGRPASAPYGVLFSALREGTPDAVPAAAAAAAIDERALAAYREGRAPHPLLPFADWAACGPALTRAGRVVVGGCRDAAAARALGFVPSHSPQAALEMAQGLAGPAGTVAALLAPPYPPLAVG